MPIWTGYNPPFLDGSNVLPLQQDAKLIKNDLIQLLLTAPTERVMKPGLGSPIPLLQFENFVPGDISTAKSMIMAAISQFEPRVTVTMIDIQQSDNLVTITIAGAVNLQPNDSFKISIGVSEGGIGFVRVSQ